MHQLSSNSRFRCGSSGWWASIAIWLQAWSVLSEGWLPVLLLIDPQTLGFSPQAAAVVMLSLKLFNVTVTIVQRNRSANVVGSKQDVAVASVAPVVPAPQS